MSTPKKAVVAYVRGRDVRGASREVKAESLTYSCAGAGEDGPCVFDAHQDDVGSEILIALLDCKKEGLEPVNLTTMATCEIKVKKPSGVEVKWTAIVFGDPLEGVIQYIVVAGDLDEVGEYVLQVYLVLAGWSGHASQLTLQVASILRGE